MRRLVLGLTIMAVLVTGLFGIAAPASAHLNHRHGVTFNKAVLSCAVSCAYWTDAANADIDGNGEPDIYFQACDAPFPTGAYEDKTVAVATYGGGAPVNATLFLFAIYPLSDWDSFICEPGTGEELAIGANILGELCDNLLGQNSPVPFGCREFSLIKVKPTDSLILRVYNWSDIPGPVVPLTGEVAACNPFYNAPGQSPTACSKSI